MNEITAFIQLLYCLRNRVDDLIDINLDEESQQLLEDYEHKCLCLLDGVDVAASPERGRLVLECAIETGHRSLVEAVLDKGVDVNAVDAHGRTALHVAMFQINKRMPVEVVRLLLEKGADVNAKENVYGHMPINYAANCGTLEDVELLLDHGADLSLTTPEGCTLLHCIARTWRTHLMEMLFERGLINYKNIDTKIKDQSSKRSDLQRTIDINGQDKFGNTALHYAAECDRKDSIRVLLDHGASTRLENHNNQTALQLASLGGYVDCVYSILQKDIENHDNDTGNNYCYVLKAINDINKQNYEGKTLLHMAVDEGSRHFAKVLLQNGADICVRNKKGLTVFHVAAENGDVDIMKLLLCEGPKVASKDDISALTKLSSCINAKTENGVTCLHIAAWKGHDELIRLLLNIGPLIASVGYIADASKIIDINAQTEDKGDTALHYAAANGFSYIVKLLINNDDIDLSLKANYNKPLLHMVVMGNSLECMDLILSKGIVNVNAQDGLDHTTRNAWDTSKYDSKKNCIYLSDGSTALHLAVLVCNKDMVSKLIDHGADVSLQNKLGETALHFAVSPVNNVDIVEMLLGERIGYNLASDAQKKEKLVNAQDTVGRTALHLASYKGNEDIVKILLRNGADISLKTRPSFIQGGSTALHIAVLHKNVNIIQMLLHELELIDKELSSKNKLPTSSDSTFLSSLLKSQDKHKRTPLIIAIKRGSCEIVRVLLEHGALIGINYNLNNTELLMALSRSKCEILDLVLSSATMKCVKMENNIGTFDINAQDFRGDTILHLAVNMSNCDMVRTLLKHKADITLTNKKGRNSIHTAVKEAQLEILELLLSKITDSYYLAACKTHSLPSDVINALDGKGITPLHYAVKRYIYFRNETGLEAIEMLVKHGARFDVAAMNGSTALHEAAKLFNSEVIQSLLNDSHYDRINNGGKIFNDVNIRDGEGNTALHVVARTNSVKIADLLIDNGSDLSLKNNQGQTPLQVACEWHIERRINEANSYNKPSLEIIYLLLRSEERRECNSNRMLESGFTILRNCARLDTQGDSGSSLIHMAIKNCNQYMIKSLIKYGANLNIKDYGGNAPIHTLVKQDQQEIVDLLLSAATNKADIDLHNRDGYSPLHIAVDRDNSDMVKLLLRHGSNVNIKLKTNYNDQSALHIAVQWGNLEIVKLLLDSGANVNLKTENSLPILHTAVLYERVIILEFLLSKFTLIKNNEMCHSTLNSLKQNVNNWLLSIEDSEAEALIGSIYR